MSFVERTTKIKRRTESDDKNERITDDSDGKKNQILSLFLTKVDPATKTE